MMARSCAKIVFFSSHAVFGFALKISRFSQFDKGTARQQEDQHAIVIIAGYACHLEMDASASYAFNASEKERETKKLETF